jgi:hypothetical protein
VQLCWIPKERIVKGRENTAGRRASFGLPNLEDPQLPAGEEIVEDSNVLDERPKLFLSRGAILKLT